MTTLLNIKQLLVLFLTALPLISCKKEGEVKLELKNKEVYFADTEGDYKYKYDSLGQKAENLVTYTFTNTTNRKYLFAFDRELIHPSIQNERDAIGYIGFTLLNNKSVKSFSMPAVTWGGDKDEGCGKCIISNDSLKQLKYNKLGVDVQNIKAVENYIKNFFVLGPNESKTFKTFVSLPIIREANGTLGIPPIYYNKLNNNDEFQLFYSCEGKALLKVLPQYIKDELEKNEIEIFDGKLTANTVKLKKR